MNQTRGQKQSERLALKIGSKGRFELLTHPFFFAVCGFAHTQHMSHPFPPPRKHKTVPNLSNIVLTPGSGSNQGVVHMSHTTLTTEGLLNGIS